VDYKSGKWAAQIIDLQRDDGCWGDNFHTLSDPVPKCPITTEQALRRLRILGFTKEDNVIAKALSYMHDCLAGKKTVPGGREKATDGEIFIELMIAAWIRKFTRDDVLANNIAKKWNAVVSTAFRSGEYDPDAYINTFYEIMKPAYGTVKRTKQLFRIECFYPISLLAGEIDESIEKAYFDYIMNSQTAFYYGHSGAITRLPNDFRSKDASRYLAAVELYCEYPNKYCKDSLKFVADWINENKNKDGNWDMGRKVKDGVYFPLSDSWRDANCIVQDCTYRISKIISAIRS